MLKPQEWDSVLDNIQSGSTIVCLGAEIFAQPDMPLDEQIKQRLDNLDNVHMYADGLFHFRGSGDMTSFTRIKQFYNQAPPNVHELLEKLAVLPVPVFINANPDLTLCKTFKRLGLPYQYSFHYPNKPAVELSPPSVREPLIYNLLGDIEHRESMVLTHEDFFSFLESIMEGRSISGMLKEHIHASYNFLFIGLPFSKWYMKILLHSVQKDVNRKALKFAANQALDSDVQSFVVDEFKITCVPVRIDDFVQELYSRCAGANLLKKTELAPKLTAYQRWTQMVLEDELNKLLDDMVDFFTQNRPQDFDSQNQLFHLNGRLSGLERMVGKGTIAADDALLQRNQIRDSIIEFLNEKARPLDL
ncbi:MAG: SIR2 family protein [Phycisphaerae bacterium]|nr:SIR2 family protein [Saprospiraceae bacterium]